MAHRQHGHHSDQYERCPNCKRKPSSRHEAIALAQELAITWLVAELATTVGTRQFCRSCAPNASPADLACAVCADGPVLAVVAATLAHENAVIGWLNAQGWRRSANRSGDDVLLCPRCAQFAVWTKTPAKNTELG